MTDIERALIEYDGDNSKPYCDLVWLGLKRLQNESTEEKDCPHCRKDGLPEDLYYRNGTHFYIDTDEKKQVFVHTEVINKTGKPWDDYENVLYREFEIEFCPKCGRKL